MRKIKHILVLLFIVLSSCAPKNKSNYNVLKEYFEATENNSLLFRNTCHTTKSEYENFNYYYFDNYRFFRVIMESNDQKLQLTVKNDSAFLNIDLCNCGTIVGKEDLKFNAGYSFNISLNEWVLSESKTRSYYNGELFPENDWGEKYLFFELRENEMIMHIDFLFKIRCNMKYYFNKEIGLYKIEKYEFTPHYIDRTCTSERIDK